MKILRLTLKKKWFDMIASGEKTEEYRELKPYWISRLQAWGNAYDHPRDFSKIEFRNGYQKDAPVIQTEFEGIVIANGREEWGAEVGREYYVIKIGKILLIQNYGTTKEL